MKDIVAIVVILTTLCHTGQSAKCFEHRYGMALYGFNDGQFRQVTLDQCQDYCLSETKFVCLSFDFNKQHNTCYLSKHSHETDPENYGKHNDAIYGLVTTCDDTEEETEEIEEGDSGSGSGSGDGYGSGSEHEPGSGNWGSSTSTRVRFVRSIGNRMDTYETEDGIDVDWKSLVDRHRRRRAIDN